MSNVLKTFSLGEIAKMIPAIQPKVATKKIIHHKQPEYIKLGDIARKISKNQKEQWYDISFDVKLKIKETRYEVERNKKSLKQVDYKIV